jgi:hypothetical protein
VVQDSGKENVIEGIFQKLKEFNFRVTANARKPHF